MENKVAPRVLLSPAATEDPDRVGWLVCFCTLETFCCRERFVCWANVLHEAPLAAVIARGLCWNAVCLLPVMTLVPARIQVYAEPRKGSTRIAGDSRRSRGGGWGPKCKHNRFYLWYLHSAALTLKKEMLMVSALLPHAFYVLSPVHRVGRCRRADQMCCGM